MLLNFTVSLNVDFGLIVEFNLLTIADVFATFYLFYFTHFLHFIGYMNVFNLLQVF